MRGILRSQPGREHRADGKQNNEEQADSGKRIAAQNAAKRDGLSGHGKKIYCDTQRCSRDSFSTSFATALDIGNAGRLQHSDSVWKNNLRPLSFRATHSDPLVGSECEVGNLLFANLFRRTLLRRFRLEFLAHPFLERLHVLFAAQEVVDQCVR